MNVLASPLQGLGALLLCLASIGGCRDDAPAPGVTTATSSAPSSPGPPAGGEPRSAQHQLCLDICKRTAACTPTLAHEQLRGSGGAAAVARRKADMDRAVQTEAQRCRKACAEQDRDASVPSEAHQGEVRKCVGETDCQKFMACFETLGTR